MSMPSRRLLAYSPISYEAPPAPRYRVRRGKVLFSWLYWFAFWSTLLVFAALWGHQPQRAIQNAAPILAGQTAESP